MDHRRFSDPYGARQPALERNLVKHRALQMMLTIFYAEELKRQVLALSYFPAGTKKMLVKSLQRLVADGDIAEADRVEIVTLIDHRNDIAHEMHNLFVDLSNDEWVRGFAKHVPQHKNDAVERLRFFLERLHRIRSTRITKLTTERFLFEFTEKTLLGELGRLERRIRALLPSRMTEIKSVNRQIDLLNSSDFKRDQDPRHPLNRYDDGRLTQRGGEICYRLFDAGMSPIAVAHVMGFSLMAARKRRRSWAERGGKLRQRIDLASLPMRSFYRPDDY